MIELECISDVKAGDLLIITDQKGHRCVYQCKEILNPYSFGKEEVLLTDDGSNIYFIWDMFEKGQSWAKSAYVIPECSIHENARHSDDKQTKPRGIITQNPQPDPTEP